MSVGLFVVRFGVEYVAEYFLIAGTPGSSMLFSGECPRP